MTKSMLLMCIVSLLPGLACADRLPSGTPVVSEFKVPISSIQVLLTAPPNYSDAVIMTGNIGVELAAFLPTQATDPMRVQVNLEAEHVTATDGTLNFHATGESLNLVSMPLANDALTVVGSLKLRVRGSIDPGPPGQTEGANQVKINPVELRYSITVNSSGKVTASSIQLPNLIN